MNPIYIESYPHKKADCYKIDLPWPRIAKETIVLCPVSEGIERAKDLAGEAVSEHLVEVFARPVAQNVPDVHLND